jgi:uncharacterized protein (TIGR00369 family)
MEKSLPHSSWCYVCGEDNPLGHQIVFKTDGECVRVRYTPESHRQGYKGVVHGGVLCTMLDETMGWAPSLKSDRMYVTGELTTRFIQPFPVGKEMIVEARADKVTSRLALVVGEVKDGEGTVYATAKGKFLPMSEEETRKVDEQLIYGEDSVALFAP